MLLFWIYGMCELLRLIVSYHVGNGVVVDEIDSNTNWVTRTLRPVAVTKNTHVCRQIPHYKWMILKKCSVYLFNKHTHTLSHQIHTHTHTHTQMHAHSHTHNTHAAFIRIKINGYKCIHCCSIKGIASNQSCNYQTQNHWPLKIARYWQWHFGGKKQETNQR